MALALTPPPTDGPKRKRVRVLFPQFLPAGACSAVGPEAVLESCKQDQVHEEGDAKPIKRTLQRTQPPGNKKPTSGKRVVVRASALAQEQRVRHEKEDSDQTATKPARQKPESVQAETLKCIDSGQEEDETQTTCIKHVKVLAWGAMNLTPHDINCLNDGCMLNDNIVDFFLRLVHRYLVPAQGVHVFSSHFYTRMTAAGARNGEIGWENVKGWTKHVALFQQRCVVIPINTEAHWWLAIVRLSLIDDRPAPVVFWLDSCPGEAARYRTAMRFIRGYLRREWAQHAPQGCKAVKLDERYLVESGCTEPAPRQENGVDCGIFMLENVLRLLASIVRFGGDALCLGSASGDGEAAWCTQATASARRAHFRSALEYLSGEAVAAAKCAGSSVVPREGGFHQLVDVPTLLDSDPEVVDKLKCMWEVSASTASAVSPSF